MKLDILPQYIYNIVKCNKNIASDYGDYMKTSKEIAIKWGLSERTVSYLCSNGRIPGAYKEGRRWQIPDNARKPSDSRVKTGGYKKKVSAQGSDADNFNVDDTDISRKPLPIGISDYIRAQSEYYYVDKTLMIKDFLDKKPLVSLFTRPRRFGKTLNMDMLRVFFEKSEEDTSIYFKDKQIWACGETYTKHQGKYPVIFLSFKDVKFDSWKATLSKISAILQTEYGRHDELADSSKLADYEKVYYNKIVSGLADEVELSAALENLSRMLYEHYETNAVIIVDEYDTPIQEGYSKNFYDEIIGFMRNLFSGGFKDNKYLAYGFLTGILRIAQESIFSGLNNLSVNTILDSDFESFFGFLNTEVHQMLEYYGCIHKESELQQWYDGYIFGNQEIYNPWSVINYISKGCVPQAYWVNAGRNEIIEDVMKMSSDDVYERLLALLQGDRVVARINQTTVYRSLSDDPANIYSILLVAGYLKIVKKQLQSDGSYMCEIAIPNNEIFAVYKSEILSYYTSIGIIKDTTSNVIAESLYFNDKNRLQKAIGEYMTKSISFYDAGAEGFYHGLVLGLIALMDNQYKIKSNRESGDGRYDVSLFPKDKEYAGIIIEIKWEKDLDQKALSNLAGKALSQIEDKHYDTEMVQAGINDIIKLGMAFSGKEVAIKTR